MGRPNPQNLNRGNPGNKGGGRPPDALRKLCCRLINKNNLVQRLAKIAAGAPMVPAVGPFGPIIDKKTKQQVYVPAPIKAQIEAISELMDRGFGKAPLSMEVTGKDGGPVIYQSINYADAVKKVAVPEAKP